MTDNAALVKRRDSKAVTGRAPAVPAKVKATVEILLTLDVAPDYAALAQQVGYGSARELRRWLTKPQSVKHLRDRKAEVLAQINAANPEALRKVRDAEPGNSMAKVAAVRQLETMGSAMDEQHSGRAIPAPGVVIVIEHPGGRTETIGPPVIDARPDEFGAVD